MKTKIKVATVILLLISLTMLNAPLLNMSAAQTMTYKPLRILIVKSQLANSYGAVAEYYWLERVWKIETDFINQTDVTNSTIYDASGNLKYLAVIWDSAHFGSNCGLAMADWDGVLPQLLTGPFTTAPSAAIQDLVFGAHWYNTALVHANTTNYLYPDKMTYNCENNYTQYANNWSFTVGNLSVADGKIFWKVEDDNMIMGVRKGNNVVIPSVFSLMGNPDSIARYAPFTLQIYFNYLRLAADFIPIMKPALVGADIRIDDALKGVPWLSGDAPFPLSYLDEFIADLKYYDAQGTLFFIVANQTQEVEGPEGQYLLNQTGSTNLDDWVSAYVAMAKGNMTSVGGPLNIAVHGFTHIICNTTVYVNAPDPTSTVYESEWYDNKNKRCIDYDTQYAQMQNATIVMEQWFDLDPDGLPMFLPSQGYFEQNTVSVASDLGYPYFGCYWSPQDMDNSHPLYVYSMLGDWIGYDGFTDDGDLIYNTTLRAAGMNTAIPNDGCFQNETFPQFARYGIPLTPYTHAGGYERLFNDTMEIANSLSATWMSMEDIAAMYVDQVDLGKMDLSIGSDNSMNGTFWADGNDRKILVDFPTENYTLANVLIDGVSYPNFTSAGEINLSSDLDVGQHTIEIRLTRSTPPLNIFTVIVAVAVTSTAIGAVATFLWRRSVKTRSQGVPS